MTGTDPAYPTWQAGASPLCYIRNYYLLLCLYRLGWSLMLYRLFVREWPAIWNRLSTLSSPGCVHSWCSVHVASDGFEPTTSEASTRRTSTCASLPCQPSDYITAITPFIAGSVFLLVYCSGTTLSILKYLPRLTVSPRVLLLYGASSKYTWSLKLVLVRL